VAAHGAGGSFGRKRFSVACFLKCSRASARRDSSARRSRSFSCSISTNVKLPKAAPQISKFLRGVLQRGEMIVIAAEAAADKLRPALESHQIVMGAEETLADGVRRTFEIRQLVEGAAETPADSLRAARKAR